MEQKHGLQSTRSVAYWNLVFQYTTIVITILSGFILTPLALKSTSNETYGAWLATGNVLALVSLFDPGFSTALIPRVARCYKGREYKTLGHLVAVGLFLSAAIAIFITVISLTVMCVIASEIFFGKGIDFASLRSALALSALGTGLAVFSYGPQE